MQNNAIIICNASSFRAVTKRYTYTYKELHAEIIICNEILIAMYVTCHHFQPFTKKTYMQKGTCRKVHAERYMQTDTCKEIHAESCTQKNTKFLMSRHFQPSRRIYYVLRDTRKEIHVERYMQRDTCREIHAERYIFQYLYNQPSFPAFTKEIYTCRGVERLRGAYN